MGKDPEAIEREIEETRARMGERVDALTYKADVKSRLGDTIAQKKDKVKGKVKGLVSRGTERAPSPENLKRHAQRTKGQAQENPLGLAIGAAAVGFLVGLLLPSTRMEDEKLGQVADTAKVKAKETAQEALGRGQQVAQKVAQSAKQTAQEAGSQHVSELTETAKSKASEAVESTKSGLSQ